MDHLSIEPSGINHRDNCSECHKPRYQRYRLDRNLVLALKWFVDNPQWHRCASVSVPRESLQIKNYQLLRHWGFLQPGEKKNQWRATDLAHRFVRGETKVWSHIITSNRILVGLNGELTTFRECSRKSTSTDELETGWVD